MHQQGEDTIRADCRTTDWMLARWIKQALFPLRNIEFENEVILSPQGLPLAYAPRVLRLVKGLNYRGGDSSWGCLVLKQQGLLGYARLWMNKLLGKVNRCVPEQTESTEQMILMGFLWLSTHAMRLHWYQLMIFINVWSDTVYMPLINRHAQHGRFSRLIKD